VSAFRKASADVVGEVISAPSRMIRTTPSSSVSTTTWPSRLPLSR
jgi:hypothetical protein